MTEPTNHTPSAPSNTGRRRRFTGAHPYPALPKSRLPLLRGVLWITWAAFLALVDAGRGLFGRRRHRASRAEPSRPTAGVARRPRMPSLTPTG
jgi:hypothetical protein